MNTDHFLKPHIGYKRILMCTILPIIKGIFSPSLYSAFTQQTSDGVHWIAFLQALFFSISTCLVKNYFKINTHILLCILQCNAMGCSVCRNTMQGCLWVVCQKATLWLSLSCLTLSLYHCNLCGWFIACEVRNDHGWGKGIMATYVHLSWLFGGRICLYEVMHCV